MSPAVGSVAQSDAGGYGHVAWVAEVRADGSVVTENYNTTYSSGGVTYYTGQYWTDTLIPGTAKWSSYEFIHFKDGGGQPASLANGGFESGLSPWIVTYNPGGVVNRAVYFDAARAHSGSGFMEANTSVASGSVGQDTYIVPEAGKYYSMRVWLRDPTGSATPFSVTASLWALGGTQEQASTTAYVMGGWTPVDVVLRPANGGHTRLRVEFYMNTANRNVNFDDVSVAVTTTDPGINTSNPIGSLDGVSSTSVGTVTVRGWSFDPNYPTSADSVHVYIGGQAGQAGAVGYNLGSATVIRSDVGLAFPYAGSAHGYETTLTTAITGTTQVCAYGINIGDGNNAMLSGSCRSVTVLSGPTPPTAPTITSIRPSNGALAVAFNAPASDGGSALTNYQYSTNGGSTWLSRSPAALTSPLSITGLANGTTYSVVLRAVNAVGAGTASAAVSATACTVPSAPAISSLTSGNGSLSVAFTAPTSNGGCPVTNYQYSVNNGSTWSTRSPQSTASPLLISGLVNGTSYTVRIRAVNAAGNGSVSGSAKGTPAPTAPAAPTITSITPSSGTLTVNFSAPATDGGSAIVNYQYSKDNGVTWLVRSPVSVASPLTITGLTNGVAYPVRIRAVNAIGAGGSSNAVTATPAAPPSAPTISSITGGLGQLTVYFNAPVSNGGSAVTNYQYSINGGGSWSTRSPSSTASPLVISGLANATSYSVAIRAVNSAGAGAMSNVAVGTTINPVGTVSITRGTASTGACRYGDGGWYDYTGCYNIQITMNGWPSVHTVRCWASWSNSTWWNFETFTAGNGTHQACSYSSAGRGVVVSVDTTVGGVAYSSVYNAGTGGAVSNIYAPWPTY